MKIRSKEQLTDFVKQGNSVKYLFFWGHRKGQHSVTKSCLSQWYDSAFELEGNHFKTAEHYMMYHKALLFKDYSAAKKVLTSNNPGEAKAIGRQVIGFEQQQWNARCFDIVVSGNIAKFSQHKELKTFLINTGNRIIVEASPVDRIWGIGLAKDDPGCENPYLWKGANLLGFALMEARDQLF